MIGQMLAEWLSWAGTEDVVGVRILALESRGQWGGAGMNPTLSNPSKIMAVIGAMEEGFVGPGVLWRPCVSKGVGGRASWRRRH